MENISKKTREIINLAKEINYEALNYSYPHSPSALFLWILSAFGGVDDEVDAFHTIKFKEPFLSWREMELLIDWLNRMWEICRNDDDMQLLYRAIIKGKY